LKSGSEVRGRIISVAKRVEYEGCIDLAAEIMPRGCCEPRNASASDDVAGAELFVDILISTRAAIAKTHEAAAQGARQRDIHTGR
jgi:hypothetical protein